MKNSGWLLRKFVKIAHNAWVPKFSAWYCYLGAKRPVMIGILILYSWLFGEAQAAFCPNDAPCPLQRSVFGETYKVSLKDGLLSIEARQAPWTELLKQIRGITRIRIHCAIPLKGSATLSFTALPVKEAVERLFGPSADFVFRYPKGAPQLFAVPQEVWILGSVLRQDTQTFQKTAVESTPQEVDRHDVETVDELIERARSDEHAEARTQALASLSGHGQTDEGAANLALDAALTDKDPSVRGYAVQALASLRGQEATEQLRQALQDPDSGVRIQAVESIVPKDQGIALLQEALSNPDELVQTIAADRLKQIAQSTSE